MSDEKTGVRLLPMKIKRRSCLLWTKPGCPFKYCTDACGYYVRKSHSIRRDRRRLLRMGVV